MLNNNLQNAETVFDAQYGGLPGCNIRYDKYSKILSINFFYDGILENACTLSENINLLGITIPSTNRNIAAPCFFEDGTTGFMHVVIGTDGTIKVFNNKGMNMINPIINGSAYIG